MNIIVSEKLKHYMKEKDYAVIVVEPITQSS